jgi:hypothetical protein
VKHRRIQLIITISAILIALGHVLFPSVAIDIITLSLIALATVPWLGQSFKSVELPGGVKVEFKELQQARDLAEKSGLLAPTRQDQPARKYSFQTVAESDPALALAGLRIEIERRLRDLAVSRGIRGDHLGVSNLLTSLQQAQILTHEQLSTLKDLLPLLNKAAHGADVDPRGSKWAAEVGPRILKTLEQAAKGGTIEELLARWRRRDGAAFQEVGSELSKAAAQNPGGFLAAMAQDQDSYRSWLEGLQYHTFTIYESSSDLEDQLYRAYYERLRSLIIESVSSYSNDSRLGSLAKEICGALEQIEIREIQ